MQMCPNCDSVYDESEYTRCPYCPGELDHDDDEIRACPECNGVMNYDDEDDCWLYFNCGAEITD